MIFIQLLLKALVRSGKDFLKRLIKLRVNEKRLKQEKGDFPELENRCSDIRLNEKSILLMRTTEYYLRFIMERKINGACHMTQE